MARKENKFKPPDMKPEKALPLFRKQLEDLNALSGRDYRQAENDDEEWQHVTRGLIERTFGLDSSEIIAFRSALHAGEHYIRDVYSSHDYGLDQRNFVARLAKFAPLVRSIVRQLEASLDASSGAEAYGPGEGYEFYLGLGALLEAAQRDVFVVDNYLSQDLFDLYAPKIPSGVRLRLLTKNASPGLLAVAKLYASGGGLVEIRVSQQLHDRFIFIDDRGWVIGQSIKDAARRKGTYRIEISATMLVEIRKEHEQLWQNGSIVV